MNEVLQLIAFLECVCVCVSMCVWVCVFVWVKNPKNLGDKTIDINLIFIPKNDREKYPFCRLKLMVEKFGH